MNNNKEVNITGATEEETERFEAKEWPPVDRIHYGRKIKWEEWKPTFFRFKATQNDTVVGVIGGIYIAGVSLIERVIVAEWKRGNNIGTQLLNKIESYTKELGGHKVCLYTGKSWRANKLYHKLGYCKSGELLKHFFEHDFVVYSKYI